MVKPDQGGEKRREGAKQEKEKQIWVRVEWCDFVKSRVYIKEDRRRGRATADLAPGDG